MAGSTEVNRPVAQVIPDFAFADKQPDWVVYLADVADAFMDAQQSRIAELERELVTWKDYGDEVRNSGNDLYKAIHPIVDEFHPLKGHRDSDWDVLPGGIRFVIVHYKERAETAEAALAASEQQVQEAIRKCADIAMAEALKRVDQQAPAWRVADHIHSEILMLMVSAPAEQAEGGTDAG